MRSGFPSHHRGDVKKAIYKLINKGFVIWYNRSKNAVQLNRDKMAEILRMVGGQLPTSRLIIAT